MHEPSKERKTHGIPSYVCSNTSITIITAKYIQEKLKKITAPILRLLR